jgi:hypothetical protein
VIYTGNVEGVVMAIKKTKKDKTYIQVYDGDKLVNVFLKDVDKVPAVGSKVNYDINIITDKAICFLR